MLAHVRRPFDGAVSDSPEVLQSNRTIDPQARTRVVIGVPGYTWLSAAAHLICTDLTDPDSMIFGLQYDAWQCAVKDTIVYA